MLELFFSPQFILGLGAGLAAGVFYDGALDWYAEREAKLRAEIQDLRDQLRK